MPLQRCSVKGKRGWRWGNQGKCYPGPGGKARARRQARAIRASGYTGNQRKAARREKLRTQIVPSNPLKADPTRTITLRRIFQADFGKRFNALKGLILKLIVEEDAFGISPTSIDPLTGDLQRERTTESKPRPDNNKSRGSVGGTRRSNESTDTGDRAIDNSNGSVSNTSQGESQKDAAVAEKDSERRWVYDNSISIEYNSLRDDRGPAPTLNTRWRFLTSHEKLQAFQVWLAAQTQEGILGGVTAQKIDDAYWQKYVERGYRKGAGRAFDDVRKPALAAGDAERFAFFEGTKDEFLRQSFAHPIAVEKVKLLTGRVLTDLKGVTEAMSTKMMRELADGLVQGQSPRTVARALNKTVDGIGRHRALMIARTETIRAHAEGQLDALESLGVTEVGVQVEWSTAGDDRVCPLCQPLEGVVMKIKEARGTLPRHTNCRCSYIPAGVGESTQGQKRTKTDIKESFDDSIRAEISARAKRAGRTLAQQKQRTPWVGADKTIAKVRPKSILDKPVPTKRKLKAAGE